MSNHPQNITPSNLFSIHSHHSPHPDQHQNHTQNPNLDDFHILSPSTQINFTAQQHFNNQTHHPFSPQNLTFESNNSKSPARKSIQLQSPAISTEFSQLDNFLKQTYQKHGIYQLVRSFVDMEDKLVSTFENLKMTLQNKIFPNSSSKNQVRCFEEIDQMDELSFQAEENVIHEFLYNLQNFFVPSDALRINQNQEKKFDFKANDFSFSESKPHFQRSIIDVKKSHIHNSRSKYAVGGVLKSKREMFSDEKMIKSINILNKPVTPLKFHDCSLNKVSEKSFKMTNSEILGQESIDSENMGINVNQEELLRTIFELRQQIFALKQERYNLNGTYSHNSSFYFDKSMGEHNFRSRQVENMGKEDQILDRLKDKSSFKLFNNYEAKIKDDDEKIILKSSTHPIVIQEEEGSQTSGKLSDEMGSFRFSMLEKIEVEEDKQNDPNIANSQHYLQSKTTKIQLPFKEQSKKSTINKKSSIIHSNVLQVMHSPQSDSSVKKPDDLSDLIEKKMLMMGERWNVLLNNLMDELVSKFRRFFRVQLEIQLILMGLSRKGKRVERRVEDSYSKLIDWYSELRVEERTKHQSVEKFMGVCLQKKVEMLKQLVEIKENLR